MSWFSLKALPGEQLVVALAPNTGSMRWFSLKGETAACARASATQHRLDELVLVEGGSRDRSYRSTPAPNTGSMSWFSLKGQMTTAQCWKCTTQHRLDELVLVEGAERPI